jgi:hypothetical protein
VRSYGLPGPSDVREVTTQRRIARTDKLVALASQSDSSPPSHPAPTDGDIRSREEILIQADGVTLRPRGIARFFEAVFLAVWLVFWTIGEGVALVVLGSMLTALAGFMKESGFTRLGRNVIERAPGFDTGVVFIYVFLIVWVTFWTFAGLAAGYRFLRSIAGRDRVSVAGDTLELTRRAGPFARRRRFDRAELRRIRVRSHDKALVADLRSKTVTITDLGTARHRESLAQWLHDRLGMDPGLPPVDPLVAPPGWQVRRQDGGVLRLSRPVRSRRITGGVMASLTALGAYAWSVDIAQNGPKSFGAAVVLVLMSLASAWVLFARQEWFIATRRLDYRLQFGLFVREVVFDEGQLEVTRSTDSDGDAHYKLVIRDDTKMRTIMSSVFDDAELMDCARWLESATGFRLVFKTE